MIRPFTCLCFLLACGSGLYLYQTKHRAQMLDREIERTVQATEAAHDQARLLNAEWMLLNDPERLRGLADQFLALRTVTPAQFTTMADLDNRLPPVRGPDAPLEPVPEPAVMTPMIPPPVAQGSPPPAPVPAPVAVPIPVAPHPVAAPVIAERKPVPERPAAPRVLAVQSEPRPANEPRPASEPRRAVLAAATPRYGAPVAVPAPGGSSLGMASRDAMPAPVPIGPKPVNLFQAIDH